MNPISKKKPLLAKATPHCRSGSYPGRCGIRLLAGLLAAILLPSATSAQQTWDSTPSAGMPAGSPAASTGWQLEAPRLPATERAGEPVAPPDRVAHAGFNAPIPAIPDWNDPTPVAATAASQPSATSTGWLAILQQVRGWFGNWKGTLGKVDIRKVFGSLAIVLGGYFGLVWILRLLGGGRWGGLPREVVEVLGNAPFGPRKNLQLVRLGPKLLLLLHGPEGTRTIGEIDDPSEVAHLSQLCAGRPSSRPRRPAAVAPMTAENVTIPARELENVVRQLAGHAQRNSKNVFEA